jgi:hypothetical protein
MTRLPSAGSRLRPDPGGDLPAVLSARDAAARGRRSDLRAGYVRVSQGVHVAAGTQIDDPDVRIAVAMTGAPETVTLGGWAAARLHERRALCTRAASRGARGRGGCDDGALLFDGAVVGGRPGDLRPVLLLGPPEIRLAPRAGQRLLRSRVAPHERTTLDGYAITDATRTAFDLARTSPPVDAVVGLDRMRALGLVSVEDLQVLVRERSRWRGAGAARHALALSADGVESPQETRMRLAWLGAGLPAPVCNPDVLDEDGRFVARVDVLDPTSGLAAEYDGAVHSGAERRSADAARQELLRALGVEVLRATSVDLATAEARARWQRRARTAHGRAVAQRPTARWRLAPTR